MHLGSWPTVCVGELGNLEPNVGCIILLMKVLFVSESDVALLLLYKNNLSFSGLRSSENEILLPIKNRSFLKYLLRGCASLY